MSYFEQVHSEDRPDGFTIVLSIAGEDHTPDWDMTEEEKAELIDQIDRGVMLWFCAKVEAKKAGVTLGVDYLGACCYPSVDDFRNDSYYWGMVDQAIAEANKKIRELTA
jgi:hypothetical protein